VAQFVASVIWRQQKLPTEPHMGQVTYIRSRKSVQMKISDRRSKRR